MNGKALAKCKAQCRDYSVTDANKENLTLNQAAFWQNNGPAPGNSWSLWSECQLNFDLTEYEKHNWRENAVCLFYSHLKKCVNSKGFSYSLLG